MDRFTPRLALLVACAAALLVAGRTGAKPLPTSLREGRDPRSGERITRPRPALPDPEWKSSTVTDASFHADGPDEGSYPERVLDELALHNALPVVEALPTTQSYDRDNIAVIEDDGTILVPSGSNVRIDPPALT